jgi:isocitrate/isopropylmalate dehydrogenase
MTSSSLLICTGISSPTSRHRWWVVLDSVVPETSGQYKVNPIATILAGKMMLEWLGEAESARRVERAVASVIREGKVRTYDMGGNHTTMEMAEAIAGQVDD